MSRRLRLTVLLASLALAATSCRWTQARFDSGRSGVNTLERTLDATNVGQLGVAWTAEVVSWTGRPVVALGRVYVVSNAGEATVRAYDAAGTANCSGGSPRTCEPLWVSSTGAQPRGSAAVADGLVLVVVDGTLQAYDAKGASGCGGTPTVCEPLWTSASGDLLGDVTVAGDRAYLGSASGLQVFDVAGQDGCTGSPVVCEPLWRGSTGGSAATPAVGDGTVVTSGWAFDAAGVEGCSGVPTVCQPRWRANGASHDSTIVDGVLYSGARTFDLAGVENCSGAPVVCEPLRRFTEPDYSGPAVAREDLGDAVTGPAALAPLPPVDPLDGGAYGGPGVADGRVHFTARGLTTNYDYGEVYDAVGTENCTGSPTLVCEPIYHLSLGLGTPSAPTIANGLVYTASWDGVKVARTVPDPASCVKTTYYPWPESLVITVCSNIASFPGSVANREATAVNPVVAGGRVFVSGSNMLTVLALP